MNLRSLWHRMTTTRYTLSLERELVRLRAENRALLNSILGIAGVPPLPVEDTVEGPGDLRGLMNFGDRSHRLSAAPGPKEHPGGERPSQDTQGETHGAIPLRRRSWQQINRMLELESARKKAEA